MLAINRSALVVMSAQPFLDWLHEVDSTSSELTLEELGREPTIYLLPHYDNDEEAHRYLMKCCKEIFEEKLECVRYFWYRCCDRRTSRLATRRETTMPSSKIDLLRRMYCGNQPPVATLP
jgi:hypothetical protein